MAFHTWTRLLILNKKKKTVERKMFFIYLLSTILLVYGQTNERAVVHLPPYLLDVALKAQIECVKETGVSKEVANTYFDPTFNPSMDVKMFMYCMCYKTNYTDEEGHLHKNLLVFFDGNELKDEVQKVFEECNKIKRENVVETLYETVYCFYTNTPVRIIP